jgi:homopolymeric O-antigen transport system ATP-binding protein
MIMSDVVIRMEGLGKVFRIGARHESYKTLRDTLSNACAAPFRRIRTTLQGSRIKRSSDANTIWALKDLSCKVRRGEVVGIIGRNGAGKSTLLKILSRITEPTVGFAEIRGRVRSLLEVGTGFHQELTGRENVYLNGAILGMKKSETDRKFDEIVAFSEIEKFIDTPVKHYSSGMYLRLAFAVAAHLEPEILLVDEVLAVGDAAFRNKCVGKMGEVAQKGRTVLFVSHNMGVIQSLCSTGILLEDGKIAFKGPTQQAVMKYLGSVEQLRTKPIETRQDRVGGNTFRFRGVQFLNPETMTPWRSLVAGQPVIIRIEYECSSTQSMEDVGIGIAFHTANNIHLFACRSRAVGVTLRVYPGEGYTDCTIPKWPLKAGRYSYHLYADRRDTPLDYLTDAGSLDVETSDYYGTGCLPAPGQPGVLIDYTWE